MTAKTNAAIAGKMTTATTTYTLASNATRARAAAAKAPSNGLLIARTKNALDALTHPTTKISAHSKHITYTINADISMTKLALLGRATKTITSHKHKSVTDLASAILTHHKLKQTNKHNMTTTIETQSKITVTAQLETS